MLLIGLFNLFSQIIQDHLNIGGTTHSGLGLHTSTINQENAPQPRRLAYQESNGGIFSAEVSSPQMAQLLSSSKLPFLQA